MYCRFVETGHVTLSSLRCIFNNKILCNMLDSLDIGGYTTQIDTIVGSDIKNEVYTNQSDYSIDINMKYDTVPFEFEKCHT